jgi:hypothetical protein
VLDKLGYLRGTDSKPVSHSQLIESNNHNSSSFKLALRHVSFLPSYALLYAVQFLSMIDSSILRRCFQRIGYITVSEAGRLR